MDTFSHVLYDSKFVNREERSAYGFFSPPYVTNWITNSAGNATKIPIKSFKPLFMRFNIPYSRGGYINTDVTATGQSIFQQ